MTITDYLHLATAIVTLASAIAAITPTPKDDGIVLVVRKLVDFLAFNWGHAENAKSASKRPDPQELDP